MRRSNDDKAKAVQMAFAHPKGKDLTDRAIADLVGVSPTMVAKYRPNDDSTANNGQLKKRVGFDGRSRKLPKSSNKGKSNGKPGTQPTPAETPIAAPAGRSSRPGRRGADWPRRDRGPAVKDGDQEPREPGAVQPDGGADTDEQDTLSSSLEDLVSPDDALGFESGCSEDLVEDVEGYVIDIHQTLDMIFQHKEVAALSEKHHLSVLLRRLEIAAENVTNWLASQHAQPGSVGSPDATDPNEADELAQNDADKEMMEWKF